MPTEENRFSFLSLTNFRSDSRFSVLNTFEFEFQNSESDICERTLYNVRTPLLYQYFYIILLSARRNAKTFRVLREFRPFSIHIRKMVSLKKKSDTFNFSGVEITIKK